MRTVVLTYTVNIIISTEALNYAYIEISCQYSEQAVADSRNRLILQLVTNDTNNS